MVDPVTAFMAVSAASSVAGGVSGMKGGKASAKSAMQAAKFNNQVTAQNNQLLAYQDSIALAQIDRQTQLTIAVGNMEVNRLKGLVEATDSDTKHAASFADYYGRASMAETKVGYAVGGVRTGEGSPLITRMMQEAMLAREVSEINLQGERMKVDLGNQVKAAKFNQQLGIQNLRSEANMQRLGTQIQMQKNQVAAMENTFKGQSIAAQAKAKGTRALIEGIGSAATTYATFKT